jgi:hypothetical protein
METSASFEARSAPLPYSTIGRGGPANGNYGSRLQGGGQFSVANVPPGRYTLRVRGENAKVPEFGAVPLFVSGGDMTDVTVVLSPAATAWRERSRCRTRGRPPRRT